MEYKPAPGEPYRPVLSAPSRLSSLLPEWSKSGCIIPAALFNGVDPPRALKPAEILTPRVTQAQPTASVAAVAAPASGIRTNEPSKTANPSTKADNEATLPPDSNTRESGSEISDPSSSDPEKEDPEITGTKAAESGNSKVSKSNSNADPQDMRPSIPDPESTSADVSKANSPEPDNIDPKQANSQPTNMQEADPKVLYGQDKPEETQGSTPEVSNPYDPKTDTSSPDRSQPKVPGTVSNSADSTNEASENPPPSDYSTDVSDLDGKGVLGSNQQAEEVADPGTNSADSSMGESKHSSSQAQNSAESRPNNSPAANTEATDTDASDVKIPGVELNPFDVLPKKLTNANDVLSSTAVSGDRQHSTIDSPEREPSFRPENLKSLSSENHRNDLEAMANQPFLPQDSAKAVSSADSGTIARTRSKTMIAGELALSSQHSTSATSALSTADSGAIIGFPSKTTSTKDSIFVSVATGTSKESGSVLSSARAAASGLHLGSDGTSSSKYQGRKGNAATSVKAKSSGSSLLASQKHQEDNTLIGARGLLYGSCLYVLLWFLSWL